MKIKFIKESNKGKDEQTKPQKAKTNNGTLRFHES